MLFVSKVNAFPGDLDRTFGQNGTVQVTVGSFAYLRSTVIQPDGKIIAVGSNREGSTIKILMIRVNADGSLDTSFDNDGIVLTTINGYMVDVTDVALQFDGKIVVSGAAYFNLESDFAVIRYNPDGSLDSNFGTNGAVITHVGNNYDEANAVSLQPDGKIIVAGRTNRAYALARYNPDGSLDATFGNGGTVRTPIGTFDGANAIALQPDGKIIAAGYAQINNQIDFTVVRYNSNGTLDATFSTDGIETTSFDGQDNRINAIALQPDGKIVVLGGAQNPNGTFSAALARYHTNGLLDSNFGEGGKLAFTLEVGTTAAFALALQPDGKIIGGGRSSTKSSSRSIVFRLNSNGTFDWSFSNRGVAFISTNDELVGLALQTDGKFIGISSSIEIKRFVIGGTTYFDFDGDRKDDISVFRPSTSSWYFINSATNSFQALPFGIPTDSLVSADYDSDGKTDIAVFRDGFWYWLNSSNSSFQAVHFGQAGDIPVPADYTGDGQADIAVYRDGVWYTLNLANNQFQAVQFGVSTDKPVVGDYDGDGKADYAVFRPSTGSWYLLNSSDGQFVGVPFGLATDTPVPADYDGDGKTDIAVYRDGFWYLLQSTAGFSGFQFGTATDIPVAADYDGDGKTDIAVYRDGIWYLLQSQQGFAGVSFGLGTDKPVPNTFIP